MNQTPEITELVALCKEYYQLTNNSAGGNLHIVLDDGNTDDNFIDFCIESAKVNGDNKGMLICEKLLKLSKKQRNILVNRHYGDYQRNYVKQ
jgi:DNA-directed RNA polymerase specialized sigma subunit